MLIKRIAALAISLVYWVADRSVELLRWLSGYRTQDRCVVLYYHGVANAQRLRFRRQMEWLRSCMNVVPVAAITSPSGSTRRTCITFDDALDSVRRNALPILQELHLPATVFVVSGNLGQRPAWEISANHPDADELVMTADQLSMLPRELIQIGSHTVTHPDLTTLTPNQVRRELIDSKRSLEAILARPVDTFSVPFGEYTDETLRLAREAGYDSILTCDPEVIEPRREPLGIGRFKVGADDWMLEFKLKAAGAYRWLGHGRRLKRRWAAMRDRVPADGFNGTCRSVEEIV
jgi:peptidoglycan/xylan/chitin deacetylase (PgdA/CDA1 family)